MKKLLLLGNNLGFREVERYVHMRGDYLVVADNLPEGNLLQSKSPMNRGISVHWI